MLEIISRVAYPKLYERMQRSAMNTSGGKLYFRWEDDKEGLPKCAETYNRLGKQAKADILIFCQDDVVFLDDGWDARLVEEFAATGADVLGVVGADKYEGKAVFSAGPGHCFGKYASGKGDEVDTVGVLSAKYENKPLSVVDGFFLAVKSDHFKKTLFDEQFDQLFYWPEDFCLRSKVFLSDILLGHHKPVELKGRYPKEMKPVSAYREAFNKKHNITEGPAYETACAVTSLEEYRKLGQDEVFRLYTEKYVS